MSLVLAFGLSPLGQVPAYAAEQPQQTQEAPLQAQADAKNLTDVVLADSDGNTEATFAYTGNTQYVRVYARDNGNLLVPGPAETNTNEFYVQVKAPGEDTFADYTTKATGNWINIPIEAAGDYQIKAVGANAYDTQSKTVTLTVGKLDVSKLVFAGTDGLTYTGSDLAVSFGLDMTTTEGLAANRVKHTVTQEDLVTYATEIADATNAVWYQAEKNDVIYIPYTLAKGDVTADLETVKDAGTYQATITGAKNCENSAYAEVEVGRAGLLKAEYDAVQAGGGGLVKVNSTTVAVARTGEGATASPYVYKGTVGSAAAGMKVALNKASDPIELSFNGAKLVKNTDYTLKFYEANANGTINTSAPITSLPTAASADSVKVDYWAVAEITAYSSNYDNLSGNAKTVEVAVKLGGTGKIESFADHAVLPSATYLGGKAVTAAETGATFYNAKGEDVTGTIGDNYEVDNTGYQILGTNTAKTAQVDAGVPLGAGEYFTTVTGKDAFVGDAGITAYFTVEPAATVEGTDIGQLKVTMDDVAYNNGNYVTTYPKVQMYTVKGGGLKDVDQEVTGLTNGLATSVTNWTVKYYKDGKRVTKPAEVGTYQAVFEFSGNLEGTADITKDFKVETGNIANIVDGFQLKDSANLALDYTGKALELSKDDIVLTIGGAAADEDLLVGTDYALSYSKGTATPDATTGLPKDAGTYVVTATFSGTYAGTVDNVLTVNKLDLRNMTTQASQNAELQYKQSDGSWDTTLATPANSDGSAVVPDVRVAIKDGKQKTSEPTLVDEGVYTATFSDNTTAGKSAKVTLAATAAHTSNVTASTSAQPNAFSITSGSFSGIGAALALSKSSVAYAAANKTFTLQLNSNAGAVPYAGAANAAGYTPGKATVTVSGVALYRSGEGTEADPYVYSVRAAGTYGGTSVNSVTGFDRTDKLVNFDSMTYADAGSSVKVNGEDPENTVVYNETDTRYEYMTAAPSYKTVAQVATAASASEPDEIEFTAAQTGATALGEPGYTKGTATLTYNDVNVWEKDGTLYSSAAGAAFWAGSYGGFTGTVADGDDFVGAAGSEGTNYRLKVLDSKGNTLASPADVQFTVGAEPFTTVTVSGLSDADTYTIVAYTGTNGEYGGVVSAPFTITATDISDTSAYTYKYNDGTNNNPLTADWKVPYDAGSAKTVAGITLGNALTVAPSTDPAATLNRADDGTGDYKVSYENNHATGTAKVTFEGTGNFTGKVEKDVVIERADMPVYDAATHASGYKVDFIDQNKWAKNADGKRVLVYTGAAQEPAFEVNYYKVSLTTDANGKNPGDDDYVNTYKTEVTSMLDDDYAVQWSNNKDVSYGYNTTTVAEAGTLKVTASGNLKGSIEGKFQIDPVDLYDNEAVVVSPVSEQAWTGSQIIPAVNVTLNGNALTQGTDYVVTLAAGDNGTDEGEHTALIASAGKGNVTVSTPIQVKYTIKKASEIKYDLTGATVALSKTKYTYNGKAQKPTVKSVMLKDGTLLDAALYTATVPTAKAAKTYTVKVAGAAENVTGTATAKFTIAKAANPLKVANAKRTVKAAKVKKAAQKITGVKVSTKGQGTTTYKVTKVVKGKKSVAKSNFKVAKSTANKLTVKKGLAKGTYKVTMTAKAKGNANYNASKNLKKVVTVVVK